MKMATLILSTLSQLAIACAIGAVAFVLSKYLPTLQKYADNTAKQDCAQSYRLEYQDTKSNTKVMRPIEDLYEKCLEDKQLN